MSVLQVKDLKTYFYTEEGIVPAVDGLDFELEKGETLAIVGESGCGKSVTSLSVLQIVPTPPGKIESGEIVYQGEDLLKKTEKEINQLQMENSQILKNQQNLIIKSTVARIMKSKIGKQTSHSWLVNETAKQIDLFHAQPQQIKENIEKLIEQNIIKRSDKDRASYEYIA